jgi:hypothetical protein
VTKQNYETFVITLSQVSIPSPVKMSATLIQDVRLYLNTHRPYQGLGSSWYDSFPMQSDTAGI